MKTALLKHTPLAVLLASVWLAGCDQSAGKPTLQLSPWGASAQVKADDVRFLPAELGSLGHDLRLAASERKGLLLLAADGHRAAGLILQKLPGDEGDSDGWNRAGALFDTLQADELLAVPGSQLLHRLFHEEQPAILAERTLRFACSCSRERVAVMLQSLGGEEARAALTDGQAEVRCEFCGQRYLFSGPQIEELFALSGVGVQAPERLQ